MNKRSTHPEVFCKKGVLRIFTKFTGTHLYQISTLFKKKILAQVFSCEICGISENTIFIEHLWYKSTRLVFFETMICLVKIMEKFELNNI